MATAEQVKALVKAHYDNNQSRFNTLVIQIAAYEASKGHVSFARDLKRLIDESKKSPDILDNIDSELDGLITISYPSMRLSDLVISNEVKNGLLHIIEEYSEREKLNHYGLDYRRKILLAGKPGTGKTLTASVLAQELQLPLCVIHTDKLMTRYFGETGQKLSKLFDHINNYNAVYLFDEFDSIASERNMTNDIGEIRRIINTFLQYIEANETGFIVGATNNPQLLDAAIFRRFDDVIVYKLPNAHQRKRLIKNTLSNFWSEEINLVEIGELSDGLNHAEIVSACKDAIKITILNDQQKVQPDTVEKSLLKKLKTYEWE